MITHFVSRLKLRFKVFIWFNLYWNFWNGRHTLATKSKSVVSETSVDFGWCLIFCKLLCLAQRHSRLAVGLSISVSLKDVCRIKSHSFNTTPIALKFIVGLRCSLLYFLVEVSLPLLVQDKKDTTIVHIAKSGILVLSYQTWIVFLPCRLCPSKQWTKTTIIWFLFISIYIYTNGFLHSHLFTENACLTGMIYLLSIIVSKFDTGHSKWTEIIQIYEKVVSKICQSKIYRPTSQW